MPKIIVDERKYYEGRGAKYNKASMHENVNTFVTKNEFNMYVKKVAKRHFEHQKTLIKERKDIRELCKKFNLNPKHYIYSTIDGLFFTAEKKEIIETELNINLTEFFAATGKTYFFVETRIGILQFYHNNRQSYSFHLSSIEERSKFYQNREDWVTAPYAHLLGQTNNINLFVC